ncbi:hypothetical protein ACHAPJ_007304 [Fusarium lateritium]
MGFFDSLWEGVKEGGKFIVDNAGSILEAGKTIAKVAKLLPLHENEFNVMAQSDTVLKLFDDYAIATKFLEDKASAARHKIKTPYDDEVMANSYNIPGKLSGTWVNPVAITKSNLGRAKNMDIYQDLSKFLTLVSAPSEFVVKKELHDTAEIIAQVIFANAPAHSSSEESESQDSPVKPVGTWFYDSHSKTLIKVAHVYYEVPMGQTTPSNIWHGAIDIMIYRNKEQVRTEISQRQARTYQAEVQTANTGPSWSVGLNVTWSDRIKAEGAVEDTVKKARDVDKDYSILANSSMGRTQIVRLKAPPGKTPADARVFLTEVVRTIVVGEEKNDTTAMPPIDVTTAAIV